jgi:hypothetical protein
MTLADAQSLDQAVAWIVGIVLVLFLALVFGYERNKPPTK